MSYLPLVSLRKKCPNTEFFLVRIFAHSYWIRRDTPYHSVFSPYSLQFFEVCLPQISLGPFFNTLPHLFVDLLWVFPEKCSEWVFLKILDDCFFLLNSLKLDPLTSCDSKMWYLEKISRISWMSLKSILQKYKKQNFWRSIFTWSIFKLYIKYLMLTVVIFFSAKMKIFLKSLVILVFDFLKRN